MKALIGGLVAAGLLAAQAYAQEPQEDVSVDDFTARYYCVHASQRYSVGARVEVGADSTIITQQCEFVSADMPNPEKADGTVKGLFGQWKTLPAQKK